MIDKFKAEINTRKGLSKPNKFAISIPGDAVTSQALTLLCTRCNIPGKTIEAVEYSPWNTKNKYPTGYSQGEVQAVFHLTNDYFVKNYFDDWSNQVINPDSYTLNYSDTYVKDISIYQLNDQDKRIFGYTLIDAYPISITAIDMDSDSTDSTQKLTVDFAYKIFKKVL